LPAVLKAGMSGLQAFRLHADTNTTRARPRMKILMLCEFYSESVEFQENLLVKYYGKYGHEVTVVTSTFESIFDYYQDRHDNSRPARTYRDGGAKIIKLPYRYNLLNRLRAYTRIDKILEDEAPDLIYIHDIMPNLPEAIAYMRAHPECRMILRQEPVVPQDPARPAPQAFLGSGSALLEQNLSSRSGECQVPERGLQGAVFGDGSPSPWGGH
jgi:Glycosyl transferase 4-like domain